MDPAAVLQRSPESPPAKSVGEILFSLGILGAIPEAVAAVNQHGIIVQVNSHTVFCTTGGACGSSNA
jgi:hypothetical protein